MNKTATFHWGTPEFVSAASDVLIPSFRLCQASVPSSLPSLSLPFQSSAVGVRTITSDGRAVGTAWEDDEAAYCLFAGVLPADVKAPRGEQASSVFRRLDDLLVAEGFTFSNVVRTWLYIDRVCEWYETFNAARSAFFDEKNVFNTFLPASTGIGCANADGAALIAGALAMRPKRSDVRAEIVSSPLQAPAMAYKSSFSRAAEILAPSGRQLFISGTASIRPDSSDVAFIGDIDKQITCTMNAVHAILKSRGYDWPDVSRAIVYLKRPEFRAAWRAWLAAHGLPETFAAETVCDVCRDEWLFEIEADAVKGPRRI